VGGAWCHGQARWRPAAAPTGQEAAGGACLQGPLCKCAMCVCAAHLSFVRARVCMSMCVGVRGSLGGCLCVCVCVCVCKGHASLCGVGAGGCPCDCACVCMGMRMCLRACQCGGVLCVTIHAHGSQHRRLAQAGRRRQPAQGTPLAQGTPRTRAARSMSVCMCAVSFTCTH